MSDTVYKFKYPACGFCRNFQWEAGNTTSGQCSETHTEVATHGDVRGFFNAEYDEQIVAYYQFLKQFLIEVDKRPKWIYNPYIDACGNCYEGMNLAECMDTFINHVEKNGLWYDLDVLFTPDGGCDYYFAPRVKFHLSREELEAFSARISNTIKKYHEQFNENQRL